MSVRIGWRNSRIFWDGEYSLFSSRNATSVSFVSPPKARIAELPRLLPFPGGPIINQWSRLGASLFFKETQWNLTLWAVMSSLSRYIGDLRTEIYCIYLQH